MPTTFFDRVAELRDRVGRGKLRGSVAYDQPYAAVQETGVWVTGPLAGHTIHEHPGGGQSHFLGGALLEGSTLLMEDVAHSMLDESGPNGGMRSAMDRLAETSAAKAPIEFGDLRESAAVKVQSDGVTVSERPPRVPRLTKEQLKAKAKLRRQGDYRRTYLPEDHPSHGTVHPDGAGKT